MHAALQERAVFVDLAVDLPVGVIKTGFEQRRQVAVEEGLTRPRALGDHFASRVTGRTGLELGRRQLLGAPGDAGLRVHLPMAFVGRLQPIRQAHPCSVRARRVGAACGLRLGPGDVPRARTVARLAGHVEVGPGGCIGVGGEVEVLLQIGGVAIGALVIPGLVAPGPVQWVAGLELLARVELEPAPTALIFRAAVPGNAERLIAPPGKGDQVLLQRIDPEGVGDLVVVESAVGARGIDRELVARAREGGDRAEMLEPRIGEVAQHDGFRRPLHGVRVV